MTRAVVGNLGEAVSKISEIFTDLPKINVPLTNIVNRAQITDFANDGLPKFALDRIQTQTLIELYDEQGPTGQKVWKATNDIHDQIRFYGPWGTFIDGNGQRPQGSSGAVCEITFYGTGLNVLRFNDSSNRTFSYTVDGGSSINVTGAWSDAITGRNYNPNFVFNLTSNLSLGWHTVILTSTSSALGIFGFEVINSSANIFLPATTTYAYGRKLLSSSGTTSYNSGFESGTLGTRGGHVLLYQKSDGSVAKSITPTNASSAFLTSADHTNEQEVRRFHWREFGVGRTDDFSSLTTSITSKSFVLDDGTTGLYGYNVSTTSELLVTDANGAFFTFTFVGTGIDFVRTDSGTLLDQHTFYIDGTSVGTISGSNGSTTTRIQKIASGLPYGTHTLKMTRDAYTNNNIRLSQFIVYAPKTPTLPTGAIALADYFIMANYVVNSSADAPAVSTGVLRKAASREVTFTGTWPTNLNVTDPTTISGIQGLTSTTNGSATEYTFFGTGFIHRLLVNSTAFQITVTGSSGNITLGSGGTTLSVIGLSTSSLNAGAGTLQFSGVGAAGIVVTGLALGYYKVRIAQTNGLSYVADGYEIITPIHAPKEIGPVRFQNTSLIGSSALRDLRNFSIQQMPVKKNLCQALTYSTASNTVTSFVPIGQLSSTIYLSKEAYVQISYSGMIYCDAVGTAGEVQIYVNGSSVGNYKNPASSTISYQVNVSDNIVVSLPRGTHKIDVYFKRVSGTTASFYLGNLTVREI